MLKIADHFSMISTKLASLQIPASRNLPALIGVFVAIVCLAGCAGGSNHRGGSSGNNSTSDAPTYQPGGDSSGGGDLKVFEDIAAWKTSNDPKAVMRVCVQTSPDIRSVMDAFIKSELNAAFSKWKEYYESRQGYVGNFRIVMNPEILPECDGTEELTVYMGETNGLVESARRKYARPIAFAVREPWNETNAHKGAIWIAKDWLKEGESKVDPEFWLKPFRLRGILLHELGHVFGCEHVAGTIMSGLIPKIVAATLTPDQAESALANIDFNRRLMMPPTKPVDHVIELYGRPGESEDTMASVFKDMVGREPRGKVIARFYAGVSNLQNSDQGYTYKLDAYLEYKDEEGSTRFPIRNLNTFSGGAGYPNALVFSTIWFDGSGNRNEIAMSPDGSNVTQGILDLPNGKTLSLQFRHNETVDVLAPGYGHVPVPSWNLPWEGNVLIIQGQDEKDNYRSKFLFRSIPAGF